MPRDGYTAVVKGILDHENITVKLETPFLRSQTDRFLALVESGQPVPAFFVEPL
jgi:UDP-galactopyranose mutase